MNNREATEKAFPVGMKFRVRDYKWNEILTVITYDWENESDPIVVRSEEDDIGPAYYSYSPEWLTDYTERI